MFYSLSINSLILSIPEGAFCLTKHHHSVLHSSTSILPHSTLFHQSFSILSFDHPLGLPPSSVCTFILNSSVLFFSSLPPPPQKIRTPDQLGAVLLWWPLNDGWSSYRKLYPSKWIFLVLSIEWITKFSALLMGANCFILLF